MLRRTHACRIGIRFVDWPRADRLALEAAMHPKGLWDDAGGGHHWRPTTVEHYRKAWGRYLRFLQVSDRLDPYVSMQERLVAAHIEAYHAFMAGVGLSDRSVFGEIALLHNLIYNAFPDQDLAWLKGVVTRLQAACRESRPEPPLVRIDHVLEKAMTAMRIADSEPSRRPMTGGARSDLASSIDNRDALMVALLSVTLLRRRNFADLALGSSLLRQDGGYVVRLARDDVKNSKPIEFEIYPRLTPFIDRYLGHHRPRLLQGRHSDKLWCNAYGADLRPNRINQMIRRFTRAQFGIALNPHRFRACAASSIAELAPGLVRIIQPLLAHWGPRTAEIYYNKVQMIGASRRHASAIEKLRGELRLCT
jgi:integrase